MRSRRAGEEALVRYVLGESTDEQRTALERQFFSDDELFGRLLELEADLVDAYVLGELAPEERRALERRLKSSPELRDHVSLARSLTSRPGRSARAGRSLSFLPVAAGLFLAAAGVWVGWESARRAENEAIQSSTRDRKEIGRLNAQLAEQRREAESLAAELKRERESSAGNESAAASEPKRPLVVSFVLASGMVRDLSPSNRLPVPKDANRVVLNLEIDEAEHREYRAQVQRVDETVRWEIRGLRPERTAAGWRVSVPVEASRLIAGDYTLTLSGDAGGGRFVDVGDFAFRIVRK